MPLVTTRNDLPDPRQVFAQVGCSLATCAVTALDSGVHNDSITYRVLVAGTVLNHANDFVAEYGRPGRDPVTGFQHMQI